MTGPDFASIRIHGHGKGCKRVTWEYWLTPALRPLGAKEEDYPCTCGLEVVLKEIELSEGSLVSELHSLRSKVEQLTDQVRVLRSRPPRVIYSPTPPYPRRPGGPIQAR